MTFEPVEGGRYFIHVDQDTLSVYVRLLSNDVIGTDDEEQHIFYQYPKHNWLVGVGTVGGGIDPNPSSIEDGHMTLNSAPADESLDETPATSYGYALDGRRIGKAGAVEVKYLYNGQNVIYELLANRTIRYTTAFIDRPICRVDGSLKYYYLFDGLGSVSELINEAEEVVNVYRYSPFGDSLIKIEGIANPYQFNAREFDAESGLYHYRSRAYSSGLGRFLQQDSAGMADGANMYAYTINNPVNGRDPCGTSIMNAHCLYIAGLYGSYSLSISSFKSPPNQKFYSNTGKIATPKWHYWRAHFYTGCQMARNLCNRIDATITSALWEVIEPENWWPGALKDDPIKDVRTVFWGHYYHGYGGKHWWGGYKLSCKEIAEIKIQIKYDANHPTTGFVTGHPSDKVGGIVANYEKPIWGTYFDSSPPGYPSV